MYETKSEELINGSCFAARLLRHVAVAFALLFGSLLIGIAGYVSTEGLGLEDAFLNSAMLLGGMGPVNPPQTTAGKLFAGCYALYSGLVFIVTAAIMLTPVVHRVMHKFHWETE
jgi:hypothetical protein